MPVILTKSDGSLYKNLLRNEIPGQVPPGIGDLDIDLTGFRIEQIGIVGQKDGTTQVKLDADSGSVIWAGGKGVLDERGIVQNIGGDLLLSTPYGGIGSSQNFIQDPEDFSGTSSWTSLNATVTANNTVDPTGDNKADRAVFTSNGYLTYEVLESFTIGDAFVFSVWVKASSNTQFKLRIDVSISDYTETTFTATSDWQRFEVWCISSNTPYPIYCTISDNGSGSTLWVWGAQLEKSVSSGLATVYTDHYLPTRVYGSSLKNLRSYNPELSWVSAKISGSSGLISYFGNHKFYPAANSTTGFQITNSTSDILMNVDSTNKWIGFGTVPSYKYHFKYTGSDYSYIFYHDVAISGTVTNEKEASAEYIVLNGSGDVVGSDGDAGKSTYGLFIKNADSGGVNNDANSAYKDLYGIRSYAQDTGTHTSGSVNVYGGSFQAVGKTANHDSVAIGISASASGADANYAIQAQSGWSYFANNVGIGTAVPSTQLEITNGTEPKLFLHTFWSNNSGTADIFFGGTNANDMTYVKGAVMYEKTATHGRGKLHLIVDSAGDSGTVVIGDSKFAVDYNGNVSIGNSTADSRIHATLDDSATNSSSQILTLSHNTSGTVAAGLGSNILFELESSTTTDTAAAMIDVAWNDHTHASRKADMILSAYDTAKREAIRIRGAGSAAAIGLYGATPVTQATTGISEAVFVQGSGNAINDNSTFGGYTLQQIAQVLLSIGAMTAGAE